MNKNKTALMCRKKVEKKHGALESTLCNVSGELCNDTLPFIGFSPFTLWLGMGISKNFTAGYQALNFQM